ncbi:DNA-binding protein [Pseudomonas putida]|jgi:chromosome segregation ATPase|uniref:Plasmid replication region n=2 Tax=Pseudomonas putida group TaxID=136845 RepID=A0A2N1IJZ0_9PSED|nr:MULTISPECIES: DNA-binding protein [Pseudomonas]EKT4454713.1 DNA-binding protein [Pseudomonas putida]EKT4470255.1 DNA-binding protein [Pseudomonas putida]EKT4492502.1 DNA-binding protein [Pseudomonas putida]EKT4511784.1 DNA-binding protein [Pseudomonas putida]EKT4527989.1 DNA-binding protein [Pseudomonas putida]
MAVGVPENDVFAAADAVLARGERPTVERVRLELGRGSPARVGALLDQWWEQLAGRLRGETRLPGLPAEVAQAFVAIWQQATLMAQSVAEQALDTQRQVLAEEREALGALEARARLEVVQAQQQTAEAVTTRQRVETRLADLEQLLVQRQAQIDDLRAQRDELQAQRDESHAHLVEVRQQLHNSREQAEQARIEQQRYTRDVEDRAYREIDRVREEYKVVAGQLKDLNQRQHGLQQTLLAGQIELTETREQRAMAQAQIKALQSEQEQRQHVVDDLTQRIEALQQQLQLAQQDLLSSREQSAAATARADALAQQLGTARTVPSKKRAPRKPA